MRADAANDGTVASNRYDSDGTRRHDAMVPPWRSLHARLLTLLVALVAIIQLPTLLAVNSAVRKDVLDRAGQELDRGVAAFERLLAVRGEQLGESVDLAASDPSFREAVASGDEATVQSILANHGGRINASFATMIGLDGRVIATTEDLNPLFKDEALADLISKIGSRRLFTTVAAISGQPYQVVVAPVMAPGRIGWVGMGLALDQPTLLKFHDLTGLQLSLVVTDATSMPRWISTLATAEQAQLSNFVTQPHNDDKPLSDSAYLTRRVALAGGPSSAWAGSLQAVLQISLAEELQPYSRLRDSLWLIALLSVLVSTIGAWIVARGIIRPLRRLMIAAQRIGCGDYQADVSIHRNDEFGELARVFNHMQQGIAFRERHIEHQAFHDSLTGLPNRTNVESRLAESIAVGSKTGTPLAVLTLNINRFKDINDTLGHHVGDLLLIGVGERLVEAMCPNDTVARLGGDEFVVVIPGAFAEQARRRAEHIVRTVSQPLHLQSMDLFPDVRLGIAIYPEHGDEAADLLRRADIAMYDAKQSHQSIALYKTGRDATHLRRLSLVNELRRAVIDDELRVYYQPKLSIETSTSHHVEALLRWQHPRDGLITPDEFIPLAEHAGSIHLITDWVLRNVIRQCREWSDMGLDIGVAVNISAMDLATGNLPFVVRSYLIQYGVAPSKLLLEITESAVMRDSNFALNVLNHLKACGVKLAIDDFGTCHSSLAHLKRLPVDELKIDKSFVMNMTRDDDDAVIVRSTIELGHNMGLTVVAEGVESEQALDMLRNFHCDVAQGYLISRPLPADELTTWMVERKSAANGKPVRLLKVVPAV